MAFKSRFGGTTCKRCLGLINKGDEISWTRTGEVKAYWHLRCEVAGIPLQEPLEPQASQVSTAPAPVITSEPQAVQASNGAGSAAPIYTHRGDSLLDIIVGGVQERLGELQTSKIDRTELDELISELARLTAAFEAEKERTADSFRAVYTDLVRTAERVKALELVKAQVTTVNLVGPSCNVTIDNAHKQVPLLASLISRRRNIYLWDSTGGGKTYAVRQVAESLGLSYGAQSFNRQSPAYLILGYMDAVGNYVASVFYRMYKFGGVFVGEELDDASADLLVTLNVGIDNGHMTFPNGETVERHPDFVFVGCGNTAGRGASPRYPERKPFDAAFANRLVFVRWQYDERLERAVALNINPNAGVYVDWVHKARAAAAELALRLEITPRTSFILAELSAEATMDREALIHSVMAGIDQASIDKLLSNVPFPEAA